MPSRLVGKNARVYVDEFQLFLRLFDMALNPSINTEESSVYTDDWKTFEIIDAEANLDLSGRMDEDGLASEQDATITLDQAIFENMLVDPVVATILPDSETVAAGDPAFYAKLIQGSAAIQLPRGGLGSMRISGTIKDRLGSGYLLLLQDVSLSAGVPQNIPAGGVNVDPNALDYPNGIIAVHHVWKRTGSGTLQIGIQGAPTSGGAYSTDLNFTNLTTTNVGAEVVEVAEPTSADKWHRAVIQSSATETVSMLVASMRF